MDRFWSKVQKLDNGCWEWTGGKSASGYGRFKLHGRLVSAHATAYAFAHGSIPSGVDVRHTCARPSCVNPDHLFLATRSETVQELIENGRWSPPLVRGEQVGTAKLNREQVREIRRRYADGETQVDLAKAFGVVPQTIGKIVRREKWAWLDGHGHKEP